jgi:hypothetical protein
MAAEKVEANEVKIERPKPVKLSAEEVRKRMQEFAAQRKQRFIAAVREA